MDQDYKEVVKVEHGFLSVIVDHVEWAIRFGLEESRPFKRGRVADVFSKLCRTIKPSRMCIAFFIKTSSNSLVIASNRDELITRTSVSADWWGHLGYRNEVIEASIQSKSNILQHVFGGIDGESTGSIGSWLGINQVSGRFAFITNVKPDERNPLNVGKISRGVLVAGYLGLSPEDKNSREYLQHHVSSRKDEFNGFNLIVGSINKNDDDLYYFGNRSADFKTPIQLQKDITYAITNTESIYLDPNHPSQWPKSRKGLHEFNQIIKKYDINSSKNKNDLIHDLLSLLETSSFLQDPKKTIDLVTDTISVPLYQRPEFPEGNLFGTVTHTVIHVDSSGTCTFVEKDALNRKDVVWKEFKLFDDIDRRDDS